MGLFRKKYIVRTGTVSLSVQPKYYEVKAFSRKGAYKKVKLVLPPKWLITDIYRVKK